MEDNKRYIGNALSKDVQIAHLISVQKIREMLRESRRMLYS